MPTRRCRFATTKSSVGEGEKAVRPNKLAEGILGMAGMTLMEVGQTDTHL